MRRTVLPSVFLLSLIALSCAGETKEPELGETESVDEPCGPCTWIDPDGQCVSEGTYCEGLDGLGNRYYLCCPSVCSSTNNPDGTITPSCSGGGGGTRPPPPSCPIGPCDQPQCRDPWPTPCGNLGCCAVNETCVGDGAGCCPANQPACGNGCCPAGSICTNGTCAF